MSQKERGGSSSGPPPENLNQVKNLSTWKLESGGKSITKFLQCTEGSQRWIESHWFLITTLSEPSVNWIRYCKTNMFWTGWLGQDDLWRHFLLPGGWPEEGLDQGEESLWKVLLKVNFVFHFNSELTWPTPATWRTWRERTQREQSRKPKKDLPKFSALRWFSLLSYLMTNGWS